MTSQWIGLLILVITFNVPAEASFRFSMSGSNTDPYQNATPPPQGNFGYVYLWLTCTNSGTELGALEATFGMMNGSWTPISFTPGSNVLNIGTATQIMLAVGGCPSGSQIAVLLGWWYLYMPVPGTCAFAPGAVAVDCHGNSTISPGLYAYTTSSSYAPFTGQNDCLADPVASFYDYNGWKCSAPAGFGGLSARIKHQPSAIVSVASLSQCALATVEGSGSSKDIRWIQSGYVNKSGTWLAYVEIKKDVGGNSSALPPLEASIPLGTQLDCKVERIGNSYVLSAGSLMTTVPVTDFKGHRLCVAFMTQETEAHPDHFPGGYSARVDYTLCKFAYSGQSYENADHEQWDPYTPASGHGNKTPISGTSFQAWDVRD